MPNKLLSSQLLSFIRRYAAKNAPDQAFDELAREIFATQYAHNAIYRRYCEERGVSPSTVTRWQDIPAMPAAAFRKFKLTCFPPNKAAAVFRTSGTTRHNERGTHYFKDLGYYEASLEATFRRYCLEKEGPFAYYFLTYSPKDKPDSSLSHMMGVVRSRVAKGQGKFYVHPDGERWEELYRDLRREVRPVFLLATTISLNSFLTYLQKSKQSLKLRLGSRIMETGGFKGAVKEISKKVFYARCATHLGISAKHCISEYGMTELSSQFYAVSGGVMRGPAWCRSIAVDPRTMNETPIGSVGVLAHYDLANLDSVMAIQTEDLGYRTRDGFRLLGRAPGAAKRGCSLTYDRTNTA